MLYIRKLFFCSVLLLKTYFQGTNIQKFHEKLKYFFGRNILCFKSFTDTSKPGHFCTKTVRVWSGIALRHFGTDFLNRDWLITAICAPLSHSA